jgi:hypothetical protein
MGTIETTRFFLFVSAFVGACAFSASLVRYSWVKNEDALYDAYCGFQGVVAGLLVAAKRENPDAPVNVRGLRWAKREQLNAAHLLVNLVSGSITGQALSTFGFSLFGMYGAWVYLRHVQIQPEGEMGVGDSTERMDLVAFLPKFARGAVAPALDATHEFLFGSRQRRLADAYGLGSLHPGLGGNGTGGPRVGVTTDDAAEAQRRRERGARALAERLARTVRKHSPKSDAFFPSVDAAPGGGTADVGGTAASIAEDVA